VGGRVLRWNALTGRPVPGFLPSALAARGVSLRPLAGCEPEFLIAGCPED